MEAWKQDAFKFEDIDIAQWNKTFCDNDERFAWAMQKIQNGDAFVRSYGLQKDIQEAISLSQYADFVNSCSRMGSYELCASPSFAPILSKFRRVFVDCVNRDDYTMPALADPEPPCVAPDERTEYIGIGDLVKRSRPEPVEKRFGMQLKRNMLCVDPNGAFRDIIREQMAQILRLHGLRQLITQLFDCGFCVGENPYSMNYDGIQYDSYLPCGCGPWQNLYYNQADFNCACQHPAILAMEALDEDMRNPITGMPMNCCERLDVISTGRSQARYLTELLGPHLSKRQIGGSECNECEINVAQREGWGQIMTSKWVRKIVHDCLCDLYGSGGGAGTSLTDAQIQEILDRTFIAGCIEESVAWQVRWDTEFVEMSGTDTEAYHRENIIFSLVVSEWTGPFWQNPWAVKKVFGIHDGGSIPADCTHAICT
jgi:hypothetical protein